MALGADFEALLACEFLRIGNAGTRFTVADRLYVLQPRSVAALTPDPTLLARSESIWLAVTGKTLYLEGVTQHPAECRFV